MDTIFIRNTRQDARRSVRLIKVDACDPCIRLAGAVFSLLQYDEAFGGYTPIRTDLFTAADGTLLVDGLDAGQYMFVETQAPQGYLIGASAETIFVLRPEDKAPTMEITATNERRCQPCCCPGGDEGGDCGQCGGKSQSPGLLPQTLCYLQGKSYGEIKKYFSTYQ